MLVYDCRRSLAPNAPPTMPRHLVFTFKHTERDPTPALAADQPAGSWHAGCMAYVATFSFDTRRQLANIQAHDTRFAVREKTRLGLPVEPWDLHVGAVVNVAGRHVTLLSADLAVRSSCHVTMALSVTASVHCIAHIFCKVDAYIPAT